MASIRSIGVQTPLHVGLLGLALGLPLSARADDPVFRVAGPPPTGGEEATVEVWSPAIGGDSEITVKGAELLETKILADDLAMLRVRFEPVTSTTEASLEVRVKGTAGKAAGTVRIKVLPADSGTLGLKFDPPAFRFGVDDAVTVRVEVPEGPRSSSDRALRVRANVGTVEAVVRDGAAYVVRWRPPKTMDASQVVLFSAHDAGAPRPCWAPQACP